jgi:hypothetical protein
VKLAYNSKIHSELKLVKLKHEDKMPHHASRKAKGVRTPTLSREEALKMFPLGTRLLREENGVFIPGVIQGYLRPWWRVRYDDKVWEELNKTEVLKGLQYLKIHHQDSRRDSSRRVDSDDTDLPLMERYRDPIEEYPENFKDICEGKLVNFKWTTGWYKAKVIRYMVGHKDGPEIFELAHEGDDGVRDTGLFRDRYTTNRYAPTGSWYIINANDAV